MAYFNPTVKGKREHSQQFFRSIYDLENSQHFGDF
jgi:hypothetical protein